jgi:hypothetical protein
VYSARKKTWSGWTIRSQTMCQSTAASIGAPSLSLVARYFRNATARNIPHFATIRRIAPVA